MITIILCLSFAFEFLFNSFFYNSLFLPLCCLVSLILVEPFFNKDKSRFLIVCFLFGFLYDIVFTGNYFFNASMFLLIGGLVVIFNRSTPNNLFVSLVEIIFLIILYRTLCFLLFSLVGVVVFDFNILFRCVYCSFLFNIIYGFVLYFILYFVSKKFNISRIN